jgi:acyl-CoA thioesterase
VPPPDACPVSRHWRSEGEDLHSRIEVRVAHGRFREPGETGDLSPDGRLILWIRPTGGHAVDAAMLAVIADFTPSGIGAALGVRAGGNSLDNTLRVRALPPTGWVLCDIQIQGVHGGFGHGAMTLYSDAGVLMALASQSVIIRVHGPSEPVAEPETRA